MLSIKQFNRSKKTVLAAVLTAACGGLGVVQAADTGASGVMPPPPVSKPMPMAPAPATTKPVPMTAPATTPALTKPMAPAAPAATKAAPMATTATATAEIPGNADGSCPDSAPVKISRSKIYHVPEGRSYAKTKAKACFASAEAAEQAGYRAPKK